jgi:ABC-type cobalamin transport system ATPase subunit
MIKILRAGEVVLTMVAIMATADTLYGQDPQCKVIHAIAMMSKAQSSDILKDQKQKAGNGYWAQLVFASRMMEINPNDKSVANLLLNLIPKRYDDPNQTYWLDLNRVDLCDSGLTLSDMKSLEKLQGHLPRELSKAVLLVPEKMFDYISYSEVLLGDPHSDYAEQMQAVCKVKHLEFLNAIDRLSAEKKSWFVGRILNPDGCHVLTVRER